MRALLPTFIASAALAWLGGCTAIVGPMTEANCDEVSNCYPYVCDSENVGCLSGCIVDADCASGAVCDRQTSTCEVSYCEPVGAFYSYEIPEASGSWTELTMAYDGVSSNLGGDQAGFIYWVLADPTDGVYFFRGVDYGSVVQLGPDYADAAQTRHGILLQGENYRSLPYDVEASLTPPNDSGLARVLVTWVRRNEAARTRNDLMVASLAAMDVTTFRGSTPFLLGKLSAVLEEVAFLFDQGDVIATWIRTWGEDDYIRSLVLDDTGLVPDVVTASEEAGEIGFELYRAGTIYDTHPLSIGPDHFVAYRTASIGESVLNLASLQRDGDDVALYTGEAERLDSWGASLYDIDAASGTTLGGMAWINEVDTGWGVFAVPIGASGALADARRIDSAYSHTVQIREAVVASASASDDEFAVAFVGSRNGEYGIWMQRLGVDGQPIANAPVRLSAPGLGTPTHLELVPTVDARTGERGYAAMWLQTENAAGQEDGNQHLFYTRVTCIEPL